MVMKSRFTLYILLAVISIQILPVKEVGAILYGNLLTEELCNTLPDDGESKKATLEDEIKNTEFIQGPHPSLSVYNMVFCNKHLPASEDFISRPSDDIPTPPPLDWC
jgi:hypothetical protein